MDEVSVRVGGLAAAELSSRRLSYRNGWVFSKTLDLLLFGTPIVAGIFIVALDRTIGLGASQVQASTLLPVAFALVAAVDSGHVLSTVFRSYADAEIRRRHARLLYLAPILVLAVSLVVEAALGAAYLSYLFGYFQAYHLMRQQYGWLSLASLKAKENLSRAARLCDRYMCYGLVLLPLAWAHVRGGPPSPLRVSLTPHPELALAIQYVFAAGTVAYPMLQVHRYRRGAPVNLSKMAIMASTAFVWGGAIFWGHAYWPVMVSLYHAVPYLGIIFFSTQRVRKRDFPRLWSNPLALVVFLIFMIAMGYGWRQLIEASSGLPIGLSLIPMAIVPAIMHYIIDGVIWRRPASAQAAH